MAQEAATSQMQSLLDPLDKLDDLETVFVRQPMRAKEMLLECRCGWNGANKFDVGYNDSKDASKPNFNPLFYLEEDSNCCLRQCLGVQRPLRFKALKEEGNAESLLFTIDRPFRQNCCCISGRSGCFGKDYMQILSASGAVIGEILTMNNGACTCSMGYSFGVYDSNGAQICELERSNCCVCSCCGGEVAFNIIIDGADTGKVIAKTWSGALKELFTDYDNFRVEIPEQFKGSRYKKLLLVAASMLLDLKFFEKPKK